MKLLSFDPTRNFPTEPIGGNNPYYRCVACKKSVPSISYEGHYDDCSWAREGKLKAAAIHLLEWIDLCRQEANQIPEEVIEEFRSCLNNAED